MVEQRQDVEYRDDADQVRAEDEEEERQQERRPRHHPLVPDVRLNDRVADELDGDFEHAHEPGGHQPLLAKVSPDNERDAEERDGGDQPEHEDMLGDRHIDTEYGRKMDEGMIDAAVGNVLDDRLTGVEPLGGSLALWCWLQHLVDYLVPTNRR